MGKFFWRARVVVGVVAPAAPTGLAASSIPVKLSWTPSVTAGVTEQRIYRASVSGGPYTLIATISNNTTSTYTDSTATDPVIYWYIIRAYNGLESVNSNEACAVGSVATTLSTLEAEVNVSSLEVQAEVSVIASVVDASVSGTLTEIAAEILAASSMVDDSISVTVC